MSGATTPTGTEAPALDDRDVEPRTPMKRLGSTRKLAAFNNIRLQLAEQTRVLEARAEATAGVAGELHDYCRRRADLEHEYARALDKLARAATQRHKDQKHKREQWALTGAYACWQAALDSTRALSRDHAALGELYGGPLAARLQRCAEDALRLHRKCRDIVAERHEEVGAALAEAAAAGKAHAAAAADWRAAALKLRHAYDQRQRVAAADPPRNKKLKALDKELEKRRSRHSEARVRALRARADYVLSLEAANATLQRYYLDDIADIILCMEVGFEAGVGRCVRTAGAAESARAAAAEAAAGALRAAADALDALGDRQRLLDAHAAAFALPRPLPYQGAAPAVQDAELRDLLADAATEDAAPDALAQELQARLAQLDASARQLRAECQENAKTLDAAEAELVKQMEGSDAQWDVSGLFGAGGGVVPPGASAPPDEQEDYYLGKFRAYAASAGRLARLDSKALAARRLAAPGAAPAAPASPPRRGARLRRGQFAAPLELRLPVVLTSCVRVIARFGLRHQGVFRVSGSQLEMQALRAAFERGEDPLADVRDASDINTVCGLLKLYLREPGGAQRGEHDGRVEPRHLPRAHAAGGVGRGRRAGGGAEPRQRARQALHPAPRAALPAGPRARRALRARVRRRRGAGPRARPGPRRTRARRPVALRHRRRHRRRQRLGRRQRRLGAARARPADDEVTQPAAEPAEPAATASEPCRRLAESTPDLVLDLPARAAPADSADTFLHNRDTLRKRPRAGPAPAPGPAPATPAPAAPAPATPAPAASPVPARNTARVAAKFAELTLTGGSLKPALAAKPALLRRPTPHPQHAPRAPADAAAPAADPDAAC
ncbi:rho GTPase-activating protein 4-like isoform X3 [Helicoverpa zea]|uniref:rho GTPase-activating protein 4-like isoform X3 n=1 Tax=Helicoverpa zea TaxID=7113 RepID=UPI001F56D1F5|nr:rho GTPase-activating protein 4-like isoform X3 [Helicoverpa zea]